MQHLNRNTQYLYHITTKEKAGKILSSDVIYPKSEANSNLSGETKRAVYLCQRKDIPYWRQLLKKDAVIQIPIGDIPLEHTELRCYDFYDEYICTVPIRSPRIKQQYIGTPTPKINYRLCKSYAYTVNHLVRTCIENKQHHLNPDGQKMSADVITKTLQIIERCDYDSLTKQEWKEIEDDIIDSCCCALSDKYNNTETPLWQHILDDANQNIPEYVQAKTDLYEFIKNHLKPIQNSPTGGWTFK